MCCSCQLHATARCIPCFEWAPASGSPWRPVSPPFFPTSSRPMACFAFWYVSLGLRLKPLSRPPLLSLLLFSDVHGGPASWPPHGSWEAAANWYNVQSVKLERPCATQLRKAVLPTCLSTKHSLAMRVFCRQTSRKDSLAELGGAGTFKLDAYVQSAITSASRGGRSA